MSRWSCLVWCLILGLCISAPHGLAADLQLAPLFADNMVLQREMKVPVWGFASPNAPVEVAFAGQHVQVTADNNGRWKLLLHPLQANAQPQELAASSGADSLVIKNVLVGEVWLASGQSNMELALPNVLNKDQEIASANFPQIRMFTVTRLAAYKPLEQCGGSWAICSPQTAGGFSAAAYFYARELHQKLNVPVGIIHSSWGGTAAQPWTPIAAMKPIALLKSPVDQYEEMAGRFSSLRYAQEQTQAWQKYDQDNAQWLTDAVKDDPGISGKWFDPRTNVDDWQTIRMPNDPAGSPWHFLGIAWLRKELSIPQAWVGKDLTLCLGVVDEADRTFVNGTEVGGMEYGTPGHANTPRQYAIPAAQVTSAKLLIAARVMNIYSFGGLIGSREQLSLYPTAKGENERITLAGAWQYKLSKTFSRSQTPRPSGIPVPFLPEPQTLAALYDGMIAPLVPYALRGTIWYQGESNAGEPEVYRELFPAMIRAWRNAWGQGEFPFYYVQLANFQNRQTAAIESGGWAELRESQRAALSLPNTGMAVAIDIGEAQIHPRNKQDVGKRLALWALANTYGRKIEYSGPLYKDMKVEGAKVRLSFDHLGGGLVARDGELAGFAVAGEDKIFHMAQANIQGQNVVVWSEKVAKPLAVRYAWATNPICNLYNHADLPASPFRTDSWKSREVAAASGERVSAPSAR